MLVKEINQLDLFSGIGGFHLGFERAGYKVNSYFSEVDKHAVAVYKHQFKDSTYVGSVTDVRGADLPRIDLITFGSPCQDFSLAGKRAGMGGERSSLITEAIRLVHECRPRVFIWENVKGTFSSNDGADFWAIIQAFANIGGYRCEWQLLNTSWFLPQNRERIYLVGYLAESRGDWGAVFPITEARRSDVSTSSLKVFDAQNHKWRDDGNTGTLTRMVGDAYRGQFVQSNYTYKKVNETIEQNPNAFKEGEARMMDLHNRKVQDISPCLVEPHHNAAALYDGRVQPVLKEVVQPVQIGQSTKTFAHKSGTLIGKEGQDAFTIRSSNPNGVKDQSYRIRRLTPIECERLQGFPDNHTSKGIYDGEVKEMSNSQRYKQCGNAVTVDVVQAIANKLHSLFEE